MLYKKIIYIARTDLPPHVRQSVFTDKLEKSDWNIEVWDISKFFQKTEPVRNLQQVIKVYDMSILISMLKRQDTSVVFVPLFSMAPVTYWLFRILKKQKKNTVRIDVGMIPYTVPPMLSLAEKISRTLSSPFNIVTVKRIARRLFTDFLKFVYGLNGFVYDLVFISSQNLVNRYHNNSICVKINSLDYDIYQESVKSYISTPNKYVVFLDENAPYHPDSKLFGQSMVNAEKYYDSLNIFFDFIENKFNVKVLIAMHPTSINYSHNYQQDVFFGNTEELVRGGEFVISHSSTAIGFAVLNNKPIINIYNDEIKDFGHRAKGAFCQYHMIISFSKALSSDMYNVDSYSSFKDIKYPKLNADAYRNYKYTYLTSKETEDKVSGEIFINCLDELYNKKNS